MRLALLSFYLGSGLIVTGATMIYHPLGFLVAGAGLIYMSIATAKQAK